jgi:predicted RNase H-like nuclease (RuvC/YqgF family)
MGNSPFRDDTAALRSALFELERENEELHAEVNRLREELERREAPENVTAVIRRLQEDNAELRVKSARVDELEAEVRDLLGPQQYNRRRGLPRLSVSADELIAGLESLWARIAGRTKT